MFSYSNLTMNKMTEENPLLTMMQGAFEANSDTVKAGTEAWMKAISPDSGASTPISAAIATSTLGFTMYGQMLNSMFKAFGDANNGFEKTAPVARQAETTEKRKKPLATPKAEKIAIVDEPVVAKKKTAVVVPSAADTAFLKPSTMDKPEQPDDLKLISGVGPKLEKVLNSLGIWTFAQVANWKAEEVAWVDDYFQFSGRIEQDEWLAQAAALVAMKQGLN